MTAISTTAYLFVRGPYYSGRYSSCQSPLECFHLQPLTSPRSGHSPPHQKKKKTEEKKRKKEKRETKGRGPFDLAVNVPMSLWDAHAAILGAVEVAWAALPHQKVRGQAKTWTNGLDKLEEMLTEAEDDLPLGTRPVYRPSPAPTSAFLPVKALR
ncbi:hypothetical protein E8E14_010151 [Neopestalotiopsis sp. 37M]|nr:hypothetical protein E8E14_010151 [Neopestalotiopsis sp. 37M]